MAKQPSFLEIIDRIRAEGDLDRNKGSNSIKSLKEEITTGNSTIVEELDDISISARLQTDSLSDLRDAIVGNDLAKAEKEKERLSILESIATTLAKSNKLAGDAAKNKSKGKKGWWGMLITIFKTAIASVATLVGGFFMKIPGFNKLKAIFGKGGTLGKLFGKGGGLSKLFGKGGGLSKLFGKGGTLGKIFGPLGKLFGKGGPLSKIFGTLGKIFGKTGPLSSILGKAAGTFAKFFPPLKAVMLAFTAFKGILGGIKGYKKGGIIGAIKGFIMAIFDFLVIDTLKLVGNLIGGLLSIFGFKKLGKKFNTMWGDIIEGIRGAFEKYIDHVLGIWKSIVEGIKGVWTGIVDSVKALFSGDTGAFKEALASIWNSIKKMIIGDGEGGGIFGALKDNLIFAFTTLPGKIATFFTETLFPYLKDTLLPKVVEIATGLSDLFFDTFFLLKNEIIPKLIEIAGNIATVLYEVFTETVWPYLSTELLPQMLEIAKGLGLLFTETVWPYLKDTLLPKMLEIGGNVGTAIAGIFTDLIAKIKDMILHPIKTLKSAATNIVDKGSGFIAGVTGFFAKKEDEYNEKQGDPSTDLAPAVAVARLKELRTTDTTGFNEDQQAVLGALKDALADAKTDEDKLRIAKLFQDYKIQENEMGTEGLFSDEFKKEQARLFSENRNNTGAQMERGMGEIADSKSQPTTVVVSDASSPQSTTVNNSTTTNVSGSAHQDESLPLIAAAGAW